MMMVPALTTLLLFRRPSDSYRTFSQKAEYLWQANDEEWFNYGKRTMECTKLMMSARIFLMIKTYGIGVFGKYVDIVYDLARQMADYVLSCKEFELVVYPDSNIVCFRFVDGHQSELDEINRRIRQQILEKGNFYIVQTTLYGRIWLRVSLMNPATTKQEIMTMLEEVRKIGYGLTGKTDPTIHE
jgi:L-2,4-diaminobutyrate decarboxylase